MPWQKPGHLRFALNAMMVMRQGVGYIMDFGFGYKLGGTNLGENAFKAIYHKRLSWRERKNKKMKYYNLSKNKIRFKEYKIS